MFSFVTYVPLVPGVNATMITENKNLSPIHPPIHLYTNTLIRPSIYLSIFILFRANNLSFAILTWLRSSCVSANPRAMPIRDTHIG